jgi:predicted RNA binding protein YcfA (HicA-like mRNA interferase family)
VSPALSDLPVRKVIRALESVGFVHARTAGSHAVMRHPGGTLGSILRQAGLAPSEFLALLR